MASSTAQVSAPAGLKEGIAGLYDESSGVWESIWGDHMHHGFYDSGEVASMDDHRRAQIRMIEEALAFAAVPTAGASPVPDPRPTHGCVERVYLLSDWSKRAWPLTPGLQAKRRAFLGNKKWHTARA
jgi:hypothetical protein